MRSRAVDPAAAGPPRAAGRSAAAPPRPSRGDRREASRRRLLDAALSAVAELGHGGATTAEIARRAGLSEGMIFKVAPTKSDLLAQSVRDLFSRLVGEYRSAFAGIDVRTDRVAAAVELLAAAYRRPELMAAFELYLAARTDAALARGLRDVAERHRAEVRALAERLFPEAARTHGRIAAAVDLAMDTLQGEALSRLPNPDPLRTQRVTALLADVLRPLLEPAARPGGDR